MPSLLTLWVASSSVDDQKDGIAMTIKHSISQNRLGSIIYPQCRDNAGLQAALSKNRTVAAVEIECAYLGCTQSLIGRVHRIEGTKVSVVHVSGGLLVCRGVITQRLRPDNN
jgi:hypothetical protein